MMRSALQSVMCRINGESYGSSRKHEDPLEYLTMPWYVNMQQKFAQINDLYPGLLLCTEWTPAELREHNVHVIVVRHIYAARTPKECTSVTQGFLKIETSFDLADGILQLTPTRRQSRSA
jgi:hypothetical protein